MAKDSEKSPVVDHTAAATATPAMVSVELACIYGADNPGDVIEVAAEVADWLVDIKAAKFA